MNRYSINGGALNSGGSLASIVYLPDALATVQLEASERIAIKLSGTTVSNWYLSGDIKKLFVIGSAVTSNQWVVTGSLTFNQRAYIGAATLDWSFDPSGSLSIQRAMGLASVDWGFETVGKLDPRNLLKASVAIQRVVAARLHSKILLGATGSAMSIDTSGEIRLKGGLKASDAINWITVGSLAVGKRIALPFATVNRITEATGNLRGTFRFQANNQKIHVLAGHLTRTMFVKGTAIPKLTPLGDISNNAQSADLEAFLMTRKETEREMTR